jgi:hypothetical protein
MDTSKMRFLSKMTSGSSYELIETVRELGRVAATLRDSLESLFLREQIVEIVEELYDIGSVKEVYEILCKSELWFGCSEKRKNGKLFLKKI